MGRVKLSACSPVKNFSPHHGEHLLKIIQGRLFAFRIAQQIALVEGWNPAGRGGGAGAAGAGVSQGAGDGAGWAEAGAGAV